MGNNTFVKTFNATGTIPAYRAVKFDSSDYNVIVGAAATDLLIGINGEVDVVSGERVDVVMEGTAFLKLGGTVARGALLTCDASGQGVTAAPAAGTNNRIIGMALQSGVSGDIITVKIELGTFQG